MTPKIKICGLSRLCDIDAVNIAKPEYIGFVFAEISRRKITFKQAEELRKNLSPDIMPVGVFVNEPIDNIISVVKTGIIDIIQLHGNETEEYIEKIKSALDNKVIKAVSVINQGDVQKFKDTCADYLLLDNKSGGTGKNFDWSLIGESEKPFFLAGGLNLENIKSAVLQTNPFAADVSSGVETNGLKDKEKIISIISAVRESPPE